MGKSIRLDIFSFRCCTEKVVGGMRGRSSLYLTLSSSSVNILSGGGCRCVGARHSHPITFIFPFHSLPFSFSILIVKLKFFFLFFRWRMLNEQRAILTGVGGRGKIPNRKDGNIVL